ncbi:hypothetical protein LTR85_000818 [Meristemomyces frigidus]|nr:hypothetical protein LTR85_000818 [Meristemomyces frigidus]
MGSHQQDNCNKRKDVSDHYGEENGQTTRPAPQRQPKRGISTFSTGGERNVHYPYANISDPEKAGRNRHIAVIEHNWPGLTSSHRCLQDGHVPLHFPKDLRDVSSSWLKLLSELAEQTPGELKRAKGVQLEVLFDRCPGVEDATLSVKDIKDAVYRCRKENDEVEPRTQNEETKNKAQLTSDTASEHDASPEEAAAKKKGTAQSLGTQSGTGGHSHASNLPTSTLANGRAPAPQKPAQPSASQGVTANNKVGSQAPASAGPPGSAVKPDELMKQTVTAKMKASIGTNDNIAASGNVTPKLAGSGDLAPGQPRPAGSHVSTASKALQSPQAGHKHFDGVSSTNDVHESVTDRDIKSPLMHEDLTRPMLESLTHADHGTSGKVAKGTGAGQKLGGGGQARGGTKTRPNSLGEELDIKSPRPPTEPTSAFDRRQPLNSLADTYGPQHPYDANGSRLGGTSLFSKERASVASEAEFAGPSTLHAAASTSQGPSDDDLHSQQLTVTLAEAKKKMFDMVRARKRKEEANKQREMGGETRSEK